MTRVLVVYGSTEGHTRTIAGRVAERFAERHLDPDLLDSAVLESPLQGWVWDGAVVGASVHQGQHQANLREFVLSHLAWLERVPSAFFSVSLAAAVDDDLHRREARGYVESFLHDVRWRPTLVQTVAGALRHDQYDYMRTLLLSMLALQLGHGLVTGSDVDYTDWEAVDRFADLFAELLEPGPGGLGARR